jgi:hypothetical protein
MRRLGATRRGLAAALHGEQEGGLPAQSCQYCHVSKMPKKDSFKADDLNDRGKWLVGEKDKQKAKEVKADWLKAYPGGREQK